MVFCWHVVMCDKCIVYLMAQCWFCVMLYKKLKKRNNVSHVKGSYDVEFTHLMTIHMCVCVHACMSIVSQWYKHLIQLQMFVWMNITSVISPYVTLFSHSAGPLMLFLCVSAEDPVTAADSDCTPPTATCRQGRPGRSVTSEQHHLRANKTESVGIRWQITRHRYFTDKIPSLSWMSKALNDLWSWPIKLIPCSTS